MTIKDIAKETGYSIGTVSRVLNNHPKVIITDNFISKTAIFISTNTYMKTRS